MCVLSINGHQDVARGLADVAPVGFLSCANDGLIFLWSYTGELLRQFIGHTDYIYRIARLSESTFVSCGEDAALRIWSLGACGLASMSMSRAPLSDTNECRQTESACKRSRTRPLSGASAFSRTVYVRDRLSLAACARTLLLNLAIW